MQPRAPERLTIEDDFVGDRDLRTHRNGNQGEEHGSQKADGRSRAVFDPRAEPDTGKRGLESRRNLSYRLLHQMPNGRFSL